MVLVVGGPGVEEGRGDIRWRRYLRGRTLIATPLCLHSTGELQDRGEEEKWEEQDHCP